ncbi:MAG: hypothetical protein JST54_12105 [Deltaproteobacteria bacterium]|nr:hypothetical protein [Deltaproteobacteria bacterium]
MKSVNEVKQSHNATLDKAEAYLQLLDEVNSPEAVALRPKFRAGVAESSTAILDASAHSNRKKDLTAKARTAAANLKMVVGGTYAIIESTNAALYAKIGVQTTWMALAPTEQAKQLEEALRAAGKEGHPYAEKISKVAKRYEEAEAALIAEGSAPEASHKGTTALSELKLLIAQADVILQRLATPGSALEGELKKARKAGRQSKKAKAGSTTTQPASGTSTTAPAKPAPAPVATQPAPVVSPPVASNPAPVQPSPALAPTPAPVIQSVPTPSGGDATAIAPPVNGAIGPQLMNGASH